VRGRGKAAHASDVSPQTKNAPTASYWPALSVFASPPKSRPRMTSAMYSTRPTRRQRSISWRVAAGCSTSKRRANGVCPTSIAYLFPAIRKPRPGRSQDGVNIRHPYKTGRFLRCPTRLCRTGRTMSITSLFNMPTPADPSRAADRDRRRRSRCGQDSTFGADEFQPAVASPRE
jgi:hypothetical protein